MGHPRRFRSRDIRWIASLIAGARVGALWLGQVGFNHSDLRQVVGYFLVMLTLPEALFVTRLRFQPLKWAATLSVILIATSFVWAALLVRLRRHDPSEE